MKIWLIQIGEPLPCDGTGRLLRTSLMADVFAALGHEVTWWASTFDHVRKRNRHDESTSLVLGPRYELRMLKAPGYRSNISLRRLFDHAQVSRELKREMRTRPRPDVIVSSFPTLETSWVAESFALANGIPLVLDVRDLWPDVFAEMAPRGLQGVARLMMSPYGLFAGSIVRRATTLTGLSKPFLEWAGRLGRRKLGPWDRVFHMGYSDRKPGAEKLADLQAFWSSKGIVGGDDPLTFCFFGALGYQFDLETVIAGAARLEATGLRCRFIICGTGEREGELRRLAAEVRSVHFAGWIGTDEIWALMRISKIGLAPYRESSNFAMNLPNKLAEYLSAGLPVLTSAGGHLAQTLLSHDCGFNYRPGDVDGFVELVRTLHGDRARVARLAANARALYESAFVAETVYGNYANYLERLVEERRCV